MVAKRATIRPFVRELDEAEETVRAICDGEVDAFVIDEGEDHRVYTLEGADLPYSVMVQRMQQGAAILDADANVLYCNASLERLIGVTHEKVVGLPLLQFLSQDDQKSFRQLWQKCHEGACEGEMSLIRPDGSSIPTSFSFTLLARDRSSTGILITDLTPLKKQAELTSRIQQLQDEERRRIARELHDSVGQLLAAILMNNARVEVEAHRLSPEVAKLVSENTLIADQINTEIRTISHLLHPPLLDEVGLSSALRWFADGFTQRSNIQTTLEMPDNLERLPPEIEIAIFRAVQECMTNVHRHSGSKSCSIRLSQERDLLRIEIEDRGRGIPKSRLLGLAASGGVGLRGVQERIRQLGGTIEIRSDPSGTLVMATLPIPK